MREEIFDLEADFANNEYFGTNVWTEEKYRVLSGSTPVLLSSPHAVNQFRDEDVRDAEKYTGAIARYLCKATNSFAIFQLFTHADPNSDEEHNYKNGVINLIENYNIKFLLDIHSSTFSNDTDIDIVTNGRLTLCGQNKLIDLLKELGVKYNVTFEENNVPNLEKENEIIYATSFVSGIPSIRLVINNKKIDLDDDSCKIENIVDLLNEFILEISK